HSKQYCIIKVISTWNLMLRLLIKMEKKLLKEKLISKSMNEGVDELMKRDAVLVSAVRTPIGRQGNALASVPAHVFGAEVMKEAIKRATIEPQLIDDVIMGNVLSGGGNIARLTALQTGLSIELPGLTIDRQCGSGINAINLAAQAIHAGEGEVYVAGGIESMSRAPYLLERAERAYSSTPPKFKNAQLSPAEIGDPPMGITAENLVKK